MRLRIPARGTTLRRSRISTAIFLFWNFFKSKTLYLLSGQMKSGGGWMESIAVETSAKGDVGLLFKLKQVNVDFLLQEIKDYKLNMYRVGKSILLDASDAEDAVSESVLTAYTSLFTLRDMDSFKPWIMKILVRECYKILKKKSRIEYRETMPEIAVSDNDNSQVLWEYVNRLPYEYRSAITLFYYEDMSIKAIAQTLSLPQGTVKSRLSRAKAILKQMIEKDGGLDYDGF
jgi:RNA polymerase sigma-70 factor (ECF subfamily)